MQFLIVLITINGALAETIPSVKLTDTNSINYLNIFNYNTSVHNNLTGLQGGTAPNEYYHLNFADYSLVGTILGNFSLSLDMLHLLEGYIYVGNSSNNPEGISSSTFISGFNIGNFTAWDYSDLLNKSSDTYVVTETDPIFSAWDYSDLLNKSSDTYVVTETDPIFSDWDYSDLLNKSSDTYVVAEADPVWAADKPNYINLTRLLNFGYYNSSDFLISNYYTKTQVDNFNYYNLTDFDISDYSTTAEADLLYCPINYNPFNQNLNTTNNVQFNDVTLNSVILDGDITNHKIYDNSTCVVIQAGTTYLEVCE